MKSGITPTGERPADFAVVGQSTNKPNGTVLTLYTLDQQAKPPTGVTNKAFGAVMGIKVQAPGVAVY